MLITPHSTEVSPEARRDNERKYDIPVAESPHVSLQVRLGG